MELIVSSATTPDEVGRVLSITPESAGWSYVGFEVYKLQAGQQLKQDTKEQEVCLVLLTGRADVSTLDREWRNIGERMSVFEKIRPYSVYIPAQHLYEVHALTTLELAVCAAPAKSFAEGESSLPARLIHPEQVGMETRGYGHIERQIHNILPESELADSLLVVEVFTPEGHWSSYPPHKHDQDNLPHESYLEETYYYKMNPANGFAVQRVYTDDRTLDEALIVRDGDAVMVPKGYHPVAAPPGYEAFYLNVMAGPLRTWKFHNDPEHEWLMSKPKS